MSSAIAQHQKSSIREKVKEKLLTSEGSLRLPRFLSNEPAAPARYSGIPISSSYGANSGPKEQWYFPPDPPSPLQPARRKAKKRVTRSRDRNENVLMSTVTDRSDGEMEELSTRLNGILSPRLQPVPDNYFPLSTPLFAAVERDGDVVHKPLIIHDLRSRVHSRVLEVDMEVHSGKLYDLIQTIPQIWLAAPKIKESFIPLLRENGQTAQEKAPMPNELRLIEGFLNHLPEIHIIAPKRIQRKTQAEMSFKRNLYLGADLLDDFEHSPTRNGVICSILIVATIIHEIALWIIQQLLHSGHPHTNNPLLVQHCIFGGVLLVETHPDEPSQMAFMDIRGETWVITSGWLMLKYAEGPEGMPFAAEMRFLRRRAGVVKRVGGKDGGLEVVEETA